MKLLDPTIREWVARDQPCVRRFAGNSEELQIDEHTVCAAGRDVAVLMSGGVDSSVTALLLKDEGWNVVGVTMKIPYAQSCDVKRSCCGVEAAYVCRDLDIPHYYLDVLTEFEKMVIEPFREWYLRGVTPSPCVDCNNELKFRLVWDYLTESLGVREIATGHYARVIRDDAGAHLARAVDVTRDQSYFLYGIRREKLIDLRLPLGDLTKNEVRGIARRARLPVARRADSMELCFSGESDYRNAIGEQARNPGPILDTGGEMVGRHNGIANYTIGQRKGIRVASREPFFVIDIDPSANSITVGNRASLFADTVRARNPNVLEPELVRPGSRLRGKIRSQGEPAPCMVVESGELLVVKFDEPVFAPTPGQRMVVYDDLDRVVAGGVITRA